MTVCRAAGIPQVEGGGKRQPDLPQTQAGVERGAVCHSERPVLEHQDGSRQNLLECGAPVL